MSSRSMGLTSRPDDAAPRQPLPLPRATRPGRGRRRPVRLLHPRVRHGDHRRTAGRHPAPSTPSTATSAAAPVTPASAALRRPRGRVPPPPLTLAEAAAAGAAARPPSPTPPPRWRRCTGGAPAGRRRRGRDGLGGAGTRTNPGARRPGSTRPRTARHLCGRRVAGPRRGRHHRGGQDSDLIAAAWPALPEFLTLFASPGIRASATLGGNLANASPAADVWRRAARARGGGGDRRARCGAAGELPSTTRRPAARGLLPLPTSAPPIDPGTSSPRCGSPGTWRNAPAPRVSRSPSARTTTSRRDRAVVAHVSRRLRPAPARRRPAAAGGVAPVPLLCASPPRVEGAPWDAETVRAAAAHRTRRGHPHRRPPRLRRLQAALLGNQVIAHLDASSPAPSMAGGPRMSANQHLDPPRGPELPLHLRPPVSAGCLHAHPAVSPHAHARFTAVDATAALAIPGVLAVLTAADIPARTRSKTPCPRADAGGRGGALRRGTVRPRAGGVPRGRVARRACGDR
jgi:hypothetical protein